MVGIATPHSKCTSPLVNFIEIDVTTFSIVYLKVRVVGMNLAVLITFLAGMRHFGSMTHHFQFPHF